MKTAHRQFAFLICGTVAAIMALGGCTVGSKSFSMDSISRTPFFGLELKERKPKSSAPTYNSISQSAAIVPRIEPALGLGSSSGALSKPIALSSKPVDLQMASDGRRAGTGVPATIKNDASGLDTSSKPVAKGRQPQSIPLPRTDDQPGTLDRQTNPSVVDFQ